LLHFGADVNRQGKKDQTPLLSAVMASQEHLLPVFLCCFLPEETARRVEAAIEKIRVKRKEKFQKHQENDENDENIPISITTLKNYRFVKSK
jgi:predicted aconitase